jgi:hypothetical protein
MKQQVSFALAAGLLLAGVSVGSAAGTSSPPPSSTASSISKQARDTLKLTSAQQKEAWRDLSSQASNQNPPSGFQPAVGSVVPTSIKLEPVPSKSAANIPPLRSYDFAKVQGKLLIVNPTDKKIADVITS